MISTSKITVAISGVLGVWIGAALLCIPLWWLWNKLAPIYFYWLPAVYLAIPFWHLVGLAILIITLQGLFWRKG